MRRITLTNRFNFVRKLVLCISLLQVVYGYPTSRTEKSILSEEKQFPNGTVIGKYAYLDKEGNPVQVKYYADDSSYGVELNSFRVQHKDGQQSASPQTENLVKPDEAISNVPAKENSPDAVPKSGAGGSFDFVDTFKYPVPMSSANKFGAAKPDYPELIQKDEKTVHQKNKYKSPDYEVYAKNDIDSPPQCGTNEKVRVYNFVKEVRKTRDVPKEEQFCEY